VILQPSSRGIEGSSGGALHGFNAKARREKRGPGPVWARGTLWRGAERGSGRKAHGAPRPPVARDEWGPVSVMRQGMSRAGGGGPYRERNRARVGHDGVGCWAALGRRRTAGPKRNNVVFLFIQKYSNRLHVIKNFQIKYGIVNNEIRNNFCYWNFSKFWI
jgi:hypothetical protein